MKVSSMKLRSHGSPTAEKRLHRVSPPKFRRPCIDGHISRGACMAATSESGYRANATYGASYRANATYAANNRSHATASNNYRTPALSGSDRGVNSTQSSINRVNATAGFVTKVNAPTSKRAHVASGWDNRVNTTSDAIHAVHATSFNSNSFAAFSGKNCAKNNTSKHVPDESHRSGNMGAEKTARARGESSARRLDASSNTIDVSTREQEKDQRKQPLTQSVKLRKTAHAQGESSARCPDVSSNTSDVTTRGQEQDQRMQPQMQSVQLQKTRLFHEIRDLLCSELKKGRQLANFQHAALEKLIQDNMKCFPTTSLRLLAKLDSVENGLKQVLLQNRETVERRADRDSKLWSQLKEFLDEQFKAFRVSTGNDNSVPKFATTDGKSSRENSSFLLATDVPSSAGQGSRDEGYDEDNDDCDWFDSIGSQPISVVDNRAATSSSSLASHSQLTTVNEIDNEVAVEEGLEETVEEEKQQQQREKPEALQRPRGGAVSLTRKLSSQRRPISNGESIEEMQVRDVVKRIGSLAPPPKLRQRSSTDAAEVQPTRGECLDGGNENAAPLPSYSTPVREKSRGAGLRLGSVAPPPKLHRKFTSAEAVEAPKKTGERRDRGHGLENEDEGKENYRQDKNRRNFLEDDDSSSSGGGLSPRREGIDTLLRATAPFSPIRRVLTDEESNASRCEEAGFERGFIVVSGKNAGRENDAECGKPGIGNVARRGSGGGRARRRNSSIFDDTASLVSSFSAKCRPEQGRTVFSRNAPSPKLGGGGSGTDCRAGVDCSIQSRRNHADNSRRIIDDDKLRCNNNDNVVGDKNNSSLALDSFRRWRH